MTITTRDIAVTPSSNGRLGRHIRHDSRSWAYEHRASSTKLKTTMHDRHIPVFDQGNLGECTACASIGALGSSPHFEALSDLGHLSYDDAMCRDVYHQSTLEDAYDGTWPPNDTGSDGLTAAKVLKERGLISGYTHTFTTNDALLAVGPDDGTGLPVITGVNWYSSFDSPSTAGEIAIATAAYVRGGHELEVAGIDVENRRVWMWQSWGSNWGIDGRFWWSFDTWDRLLHEDGDVTVLIPRRSPAPTPVPIPNPDAELATAFRRDGWVSAHHTGDNHHVALAAQAWLREKHL